MGTYTIIRFYHLWESVDIEADSYEEAEAKYYDEGGDWEFTEMERDYRELTIEAN